MRNKGEQFEETFNSDLRNFRNEEIENLKEYTKQYQISAESNAPMAMYNWTRFVRTNEVTRLLSFLEIYHLIKDIHGYTLQLGVLDGNTLFSFAHFQEIFEPRNYLGKIYGFDTFGDNDYGDKGYEDGDYLNQDIKTIPKVADYEQLKKSVDLFNKSRLFNQFNLIELIKGNALNTVPEFVEKNPGCVIRLLNLGISLYKVEKKALEIIWPRIPIGGVVTFGSLGSEISPGIGLFLNEVLGIGNVKIRRIPFGTKLSYIVKE